jgi:hypothetical protein
MQRLKWLGVFIENEGIQVLDYNDMIGQRYQYCGFPNIQMHNLSLDPYYVNPSLSDYHLLAGSHAINQWGGSIAPVTDVDGILRTQNYKIDMDAYEFIYLKVFLPIVMKVSQGDISPTGLR